MAESAVTIKNVYKYFGDRIALQDLSLEIPQGSMLGIIGPNGSGKTTTLRLILNIYQPDKGEVWTLGKCGGRLANDLIGYLPEERGLYRKMKVQAQLKYFAHLKGMPNNAIDDAINFWLERMGLAECKQMRIEQMSKGMAQKIQFIAAVIFKPRLIILDEPFSGLDPVNLHLVNDVIHELHDSGVTVILSTHDMAVAERLCDSVIMLHQGHKVLDGSIKAIRRQYGEDKIHLGFSGRREQVESIPGVESVRAIGRLLEISYQGSPQDLLQALIRQGEISHFELAHSSLHDIFMLKVAEEANS